MSLRPQTSLRKKFSKLLTKIRQILDGEAHRLLVIPTATLAIFVYFGFGLWCAEGGPSLIEDMSATDVLCSLASIFCIATYIIKLLTPRVEEKENSKIKKRYLVLVVLLIATYVGAYLWINWKSGANTHLSALGSALTIVGLGTIFIDYILEVVH